MPHISPIDDMFTDAPFTICLEIEELNDIVVNQNNSTIKISHDCYCYESNPRPTLYLSISTPHNITKKDVLEYLIDFEYNPDCNHIFLETIEYNNGFIELFFGS